MKHLPYKWKALLAVALGTIMATLDASIINIAFPKLALVFDTDLTKVMWVSVAYILVSSGLMLVFGKLSDLVGRKRIYVIGLGIFTIGMAACSLAHSLEQLIFFRVLQALGAAMSVGCSTAIVAEAFPSEDMGKGLGMLGVAVSVGFIVGPVAGGFLLDWLDWRAIFYTRIPLTVLAFILATTLLRKDHLQRKRIDLDIPGTVASFTGLFCLLFGMGQIKARGLTSSTVMILVGSGLIILCLLPVIERRAKDPIIQFELFRNREFAYAMAAFLVFFLTLPGYILILPFYLMDGIRLSASDTGLLTSVISLTTMIVSPIGGTVSDRFGPKWPCTLGAGAIAAAFFCMFLFNLQTGVGMIALVLALLGTGLGLFQPPNNSIIMSAVDPNYFGSASALTATNRQIGLSLGMALAGVVFSTRQGIYHDLFRLKGLDATQALRHSIAPAFSDLMLISFLLALAVVVLSFVSAKRRQAVPDSAK